MQKTGIEDWEEMTPEQRDRLVADSVMGWQEQVCQGSTVTCDEFWYCSHCGFEGNWGNFDTFVEHTEVPMRYSQDMNAAWQVVKHVRDSWLFSKRRHFFDEIQRLVTDASGLHEPGTLLAWPDLLFWVTEEVICLAALKSVGRDELERDTPSQ